MTEPIFEITSYNAKTKNLRARLHPSAGEQRGPWRWPLTRVGNRDPIVLTEHVTQERRGVDLGYEVTPFDSELYVPVHAVQSGDVSFATEGANGSAVSLDHGDYTTHYGHMSKMFVTRCLGSTRRRQYVRAGEVVGYAAKAPLHFRFELWNWTDDRGLVAIDPVPFLNEWRIVPPDNELCVRVAMPNAETEAA
jgi:murein DD-endopeptidase MepM/ murein hydrolase activator NlpD